MACAVAAPPASQSSGLRASFRNTPRGPRAVFSFPSLKNRIRQRSRHAQAPGAPCHLGGNPAGTAGRPLAGNECTPWPPRRRQGHMPQAAMPARARSRGKSCRQVTLPRPRRGPGVLVWSSRGGGMRKSPAFRSRTCGTGRSPPRATGAALRTPPTGVSAGGGVQNPRRGESSRKSPVSPRRTEPADTNPPFSAGPARAHPPPSAPPPRRPRRAPPPSARPRGWFPSSRMVRGS